MAELTIEDQAFIQRVRKRMKTKRITGWVCIAIPILCWMLVVVNAHWLIQRMEQFLRTPPSIFVPVGQRVNAENARLRTLRTATPLEGQLADRLIRTNEALLVSSAVNLLVIFVLTAKLALTWLLIMGVLMLVSARRDRRWLKLLETVERDAH